MSRRVSDGDDADDEGDAINQRRNDSLSPRQSGPDSTTAGDSSAFQFSSSVSGGSSPPRPTSMSSSRDSGRSRRSNFSKRSSRSRNSSRLRAAFNISRYLNFLRPKSHLNTVGPARYQTTRQKYEMDLDIVEHILQQHARDKAEWQALEREWEETYNHEYYDPFDQSTAFEDVMVLEKDKHAYQPSARPQRAATGSTTAVDTSRATSTRSRSTNGTGSSTACSRSHKTFLSRPHFTSDDPKAELDIYDYTRSGIGEAFPTTNITRSWPTSPRQYSFLYSPLTHEYEYQYGSCGSNSEGEETDRHEWEWPLPPSPPQPEGRWEGAGEHFSRMEVEREAWERAKREREKLRLDREMKGLRKELYHERKRCGKGRELRVMNPDPLDDEDDVGSTKEEIRITESHALNDQMVVGELEFRDGEDDW
ncbi:hypothetical protein DL93DRAFT_2087065 [Clavulina sp. PMI_390]|nr:hypothetical protein DL93DRAFT_2087065 [Clavulina sp. PMI_390]